MLLENRRGRGRALALSRSLGRRTDWCGLRKDDLKVAVRPCTNDWRRPLRTARENRGNPRQPWDLRHSTIVTSAGTFVPFQVPDRGITFIPEQFWGRAARASVTRKSLGARFIFGGSSPFETDRNTAKRLNGDISPSTRPGPEYAPASPFRVPVCCIRV